MIAARVYSETSRSFSSHGMTTQRSSPGFLEPLLSSWFKIRSAISWSESTVSSVQSAEFRSRTASQKGTVCPLEINSKTCRARSVLTNPCVDLNIFSSIYLHITIWRWVLPERAAWACLHPPLCPRRADWSRTGTLCGPSQSKKQLAPLGRQTGRKCTSKRRFGELRLGVLPCLASLRTAMQMHCLIKAETWPTFPQRVKPFWLSMTTRRYSRLSWPY